MPSLVAFGRRWNISSDDFVFPELTEAFIRIGWFDFLLYIYNTIYLTFKGSVSVANFSLSAI